MHFAPPLEFTNANVNPTFSFRVGGIFDLPIDHHWYFQTGLFFSRKGAQRNFSYYGTDSNNVGVNQTLQLNYLELPMSLLIKSDHQGKLRAFAGLGVTLSNVIGGRNLMSVTGDTTGVPFHNSYNLKVSTTTTVNGFDAGMDVQAGLELPTGLYFKVYYLLGITDFGVGTEIDKNRMFCIVGGWYFGKFRNINRDDDDLIDSQVQ